MNSLERVILKRKSIEDYRPIVGGAVVEEIRAVAANLRGLRLLHLNSTASGGGVAELLNSLVPLEADCGLEVEWRVLCKDEPFFRVTKSIHNGLQGKVAGLSRQEQEIYLRRNEQCSAMCPRDYDAVVVHDPQPAAFRQFVGDGAPDGSGVAISTRRNRTRRCGPSSNLSFGSTTRPYSPCRSLPPRASPGHLWPSFLRR